MFKKRKITRRATFAATLSDLKSGQRIGEKDKGENVNKLTTASLSRVWSIVPPML